MSDASTGASAPSTASTPSQGVVSESNLPGVADIDQGVGQAVAMAEAEATAAKEAKQSEQQTPEEAIEEVIEDFEQIWKTKKGKETLKVNGKSRDIQDYNDLKRLAQLGLAANEKFQQASEKIKQAEAIVELLQTNPEKALEKLGFNVRDMAEEYLKNELQREVLTDEQRKLLDMERKLAEYEADKKAKEEDEKASRISELQRHYETELSDKIIKTIETYKLPRSERTISRIAEKLYVALENGYEIDPMDLGPLVKQEIDEELRGMYGTLDVEAMLSILGEDNLKKIREHELKKVKQKAPQDPIKTTQVASVQAEEPQSKSRKAARDFFKELEDKYK
jgi:hypothetical protein